MPRKNTSGHAYGLTLLCPIINSRWKDKSYAEILRASLDELPSDNKSPMAKVPDTYLARFYILNDVFYQGYRANEEHLKSRYLVFSSNFYGDRDTYLEQMWKAAEAEVKHIWQYCVAFADVSTAEDFVAYCKKCQVDNNLFFNGSTDDSLAEQLKALYLKQEFTRFVYKNQGLSPALLQQNFSAFVQETQPSNVDGPSWRPGAQNYASR